MTPLKINRAFNYAGVPDMPMTRRHIMRNIQEHTDPAVLATLTAKQLAALITAANTSCHDGRASKGDVELCDGDAVWIGLNVQKMIPLEDLRSMQTDRVQSV